MKRTILITVLAIALTLIGCAPKEDDMDISNVDNSGNDSSSQLVTYGVAGFITDITPGDEYGTILVEGELNKNGAHYDKGQVRINEDTLIYYNDQGSYEDIEIGQYVQVFFEGPVAESYPVQGTARQVSIVDAPVFVEDPTEVE